MWTIELPAMKKLLLPLTLLLAGCTPGQEQSPWEFAERLRAIIASNDTAAFSELPCLPTDCIDQDAIDYVFGTDSDESYLARFLQRNDIEVKVFGPIEYADASRNSEFVVMYYDPEIVLFDSGGHMSEKDRKDLWWNGYVETIVVVKNGEWAFYRTPFYYGAHLPWAEDY